MTHQDDKLTRLFESIHIVKISEVVIHIKVIAKHLLESIELSIAKLSTTHGANIVIIGSIIFGIELFISQSRLIVLIDLLISS